MALHLLPGAVGQSPSSALHASAAGRLRRYREYLDFYGGKHWLRPRLGRSNLSLNYARAVVDKGVSYLLGRGLNFSVIDAQGGRTPQTAQTAERFLYETYQDNDLDAIDLAAALNAGLLGDAVFKVFYDPDVQRVRVINLDPMCFFPRWPGDDPTSLCGVDLVYRTPLEDAQRLYPDGRAWPGSAAASGGLDAAVTVVERWTATELSVQIADQEISRKANPYGFIPLGHVANLQPPNESWGVSDLRDLIGLNRALNERMSDQADLIRYHADPPVVFKGVSEHTDLSKSSTRTPGLRRHPDLRRQSRESLAGYSPSYVEAV